MHAKNAERLRQFIIKASDESNRVSSEEPIDSEIEEAEKLRLFLDPILADPHKHCIPYPVILTDTGCKDYALDHVKLSDIQHTPKLNIEIDSISSEIKTPTKLNFADALDTIVEHYNDIHISNFSPFDHQGPVASSWDSTIYTSRDLHKAAKVRNKRKVIKRLRKQALRTHRK